MVYTNNYDKILNYVKETEVLEINSTFLSNLLNNKNISLRYVKDDIFDDVKTINNLTVKCYDLERTLCDIIKDKNRMDKEIYSKALKEYARNKDKNILKLIKYAKKLDIEDEVVELMKVIL